MHFWKILNLCSSLNVRDQVSHPYKTSKITLLLRVSLPSGCRWWRKHLDMKGSCKHFEYAVMDSWQQVVLQLADYAGG
jgi:hypothetical protein